MPDFRNMPVPPVPMPDARNVPQWAMDQVWNDEDRAAMARAVQNVQQRVGLAQLMAAPATETKQGEELFQLILSGIREIYDVEGTIAGGAVRDLSLGVKSKDVDVFLPMTQDKFFEGFEELGWHGGYAPVPIKDYKDNNLCGFKSTARGTATVQRSTLDLIFMDEPLTKEMVNKFPVFIQRGVWTLGGGLMFSPEAQADLDNRTFTIDPTINDKERLKGILKKVKDWQKREHFKGWKIIEPDVKEWWEIQDEEKKQKEQMEKNLQDQYNTMMTTYSTVFLK